MSALPATTGALASDVLRRQSQTFLDLAPGARSGHSPEAVHQMRVAARRMRAALRLFADVLPQPVAQHLNAELKWIASQLGQARDLDVQLKFLDATAERLGLAQQLRPYRAWLEQQRAQAQAALEDALRSPRFMALVHAFDELASWTSPNDVPLLEDAPRRLRQAFKAVAKRARKLERHSPAADFHKVRIRAKRLRYAAEFFAPAYGEPAERLVKRLVKVQDVLGELQDGVVADEHIRQAIHAAADTWPAETVLALGQVVQDNAERAKRLRRRFKKVYEEVAGTAWKRLESKVAIS
jgi:CHAD domain-containing protein